jgi:hypothetical protein
MEGFSFLPPLAKRACAVPIVRTRSHEERRSLVALRLMENYEIRNVLLDYRCMAVCLRAGSCCARCLGHGVRPQSARLPVAVLQPVPFELRGIRIGDEIKEAERKFLSWKILSRSSNPGLCGSDGINRIETCTDVLDTEAL